MRYFVEEIEDLDGLGVTAFTSVPMVHSTAHTAKAPQPVSSGHAKTIHLGKRGVLVQGKTGPARIHATPRAPVRTSVPQVQITSPVNVAALNTSRKVHAGVLASRGSAPQTLSRGQTITGGSMTTATPSSQPAASRQTLTVNQGASTSMHAIPRDEPQVEIVDGTRVDTAPVESAPVEQGWSQVDDTELVPTEPVTEEVVYTSGGATHDPMVEAVDVSAAPSWSDVQPAMDPLPATPEGSAAPETPEKKGISPLAVLGLLAGGYFLLNS